MTRTDRRYTEAIEGVRTPFQRDRDRILYCSAFRRLAGVTQVASAAEGHPFHNRLTHSLKVAQTGRRLSEYILSTVPAEVIRTAGELDVDVVEAACLAHDLGHPPFGHIAEQELHDKYLHHGILDGFEGNAQTFRCVTKLAIRRTEYLGLNLTRATLNAIIKYPSQRGVAGEKAEKWGYYFDESDDFQFARMLMPPGDEHRCLEADIMNWADDVTYSVHDVDDFYRARLLPLNQILANQPEAKRFIEELPAGLRTSAQDFLAELSGFVKGRQELWEPYIGSREQRAAISNFTSFLITRYIGGGTELPPWKINPAPKKDEHFIQVNDKVLCEVKLLKEMARHYVFNHPALVAQQYGQKKVIGGLFDILFEACLNKKDNGIIPAIYRKDVEGLSVFTGDEKRRKCARLATDIISGLTEPQALNFHQRLTGQNSGALLDQIVR